MKQLRYLVVAVLAACGESESSRFDELAASMEGIYSVETYTRNAAACLPGGESQLATDTFALVVAESAFGTRYLSVKACSSVAECRSLLGSAASGGDFYFAVHEPAGDATLTGEGRSTGFGDGTTCRGAELQSTTLTLTGSTLHLEQEITVADAYPVDAEGFCTTDGAARAAAGKTCSQLEALDATFVEALPR
ncbi:MAG: hypothetical protein M3680_04955 [Myxococcota bacterium]|nr:hypothetical protein [Myxococcota bacterium]